MIGKQAFNPNKFVEFKDKFRYSLKGICAMCKTTYFITQLIKILI